MTPRVLGRTGLAVSPVGFGAWAIGGTVLAIDLLQLPNPALGLIAAPGTYQVAEDLTEERKIPLLRGIGAPAPGKGWRRSRWRDPTRSRSCTTSYGARRRSGSSPPHAPHPSA